MPEPIVPNKNASMSSRLTWADPKASVAASTKRSSALLSHRSPNGVQPIPTIVTWSRIPLDAMSVTLLARRGPDRSGFPEIVMHPVRRREEATERHLHAVANLDRTGVNVSEFAPEPATAVKVDHRRNDWR